MPGRVVEREDAGTVQCGGETSALLVIHAI